MHAESTPPPSSSHGFKKLLVQSRLAKNRKTSGLAAFVLLALVIAVVTTQQRVFTKEEAKESSQNQLIENVEYQTILPAGKAIDTLGGWKQVSPDGQDPVYAYTDTLGGVSISVSQQPIPDAFIGNTARRVAELAKSYGATTELTAGDTLFFIGTSAKGPQSVIFTKNNLLIMIKSESQITNDAWISYVSGLN